MAAKNPLNDLGLIEQKKAERCVDVVLERLNAFEEPGVTDELHQELTQMVRRVMNPEFDDHRNDFESSNISNIAYDKEARVLQIDFHAGTRYQYYGVEPEKAGQLFEAESKGKYFTSAVKPNYPYVRVS